MKAIKLILLISLFFFILNPLFAQSPRSVQLFNANWKFSFGEKENQFQPRFDDSNWDAVFLPHDASIYGPFLKEKSNSANGWRPHNQGWYRKSFVLPENAKNKKVFIEFEGVYRDAEVWINGKYLGRKLNGYLGFEYDLSEYLNHEGENCIAVYYNNTVQNTSRWYTGEGIYRNVWLKILNPVHVPLYGTYLTTPFVTTDLAKITLETNIVNQSDKTGNVRIETHIIDQTGKIVARKSANVVLQFVKEYTFRQELKVENPNLWDTENPYLYQAESTVYFNNEMQDIYITTFGIRNIELNPEQGLVLNGKKVFAQGGDIHHDLGCLGAVTLKSGYKFRLQKLKEMGCNSIRLSHNPHATVLLDLCDEMGFLVIDEAYDKWTSQYYGGEVAFADAWKNDMETFIKRDRNHPSVYLWSMGNEVLKQQGNFDKKFETKKDGEDYGVKVLNELADFTRSLDPSRKITAALFPLRETGIFEWNEWENHEKFMQTAPPPMAFHMDVVSWNYTGNMFEIDHQNYPQMMFLGSETSTNLDFGNRKISMLEFDKSYVIGHYYWTALSYLGESPWPRKGWSRAFYGMDEQMTPIGYIYQSFYSEKPMLKMMVKEPDPQKLDFWDKQFDNKRWSWYPMHNHWNWKGFDKLEVQVFTNCDEVELFLNEKSLGTKLLKDSEESYLIWEIPYKKGELRAVAKNRGKVVGTDKLQTSAKAKQVVLKPHSTKMQANGLDLVYIEVELQDEKGIIVPDADRQITFTIEGEASIAGVANADVNSDEWFQNNKRTTVDGKCLLVVRSKNKAGEIKIIASANGLPKTQINLQAE